MLGFFEVDADKRPTSFKTARPIRFICKVVLQRRQQKGTKLALRSINRTQRPILDQVEKKTLNQILRIFGRIPPVAYKSVERVPVKSA